MEDKQFYKGKKVLVLGLAKSGEAAARLLLRLGAEVTVNDAKPYEENLQAKELEQIGVNVVCGAHPLSLLDEPFDVIVKNPGIPYQNPIIQEAMKRQLPIVTEIELASAISEAEIIAITGSNGKTTTTTLIHEMLKNSVFNPLIAGNIGTVACEVAEEASKEDVVVMEVSSFQLLGTIHFHPKVAVLLNIFDAHLDYHGTKDEYVSAKAKITANQTPSDYLVYNADDPYVVKMAEQSDATLVPFSTTKKLEKGLCVVNDFIVSDGDSLIHINEIVLPGSHNLENVLAAVGAATIMGASNEQIKHVLTTFSGVEHRLQFVKSFQDRMFYNDSKATNILAASKALEAFNQPVILLAGGLDRGNEFDDLIPALKGVKGIVTFGETKEKIAATAKKANVPVHFANRVEDGVEVAYNLSEKNDIILLSPACASWDQYKTFEERGRSFIEAIEKLS
ncbi:UDP-N-acetylmuramoyl-L-alanine--D-glutamate ligase [Halalkalibacter urbisdiaboli]|uniref:UDP-N-acetylmuramoyl-L-alanine--D-glutamate ligase n=1 Tax=Halalkalibacter urbisdiaboli TaxID=1960589 RepID=UPI000B44B55D|nr:UDP-N-acetylmuramoyl-L-alanine--D-glutamate ligase [Halalkalibacter urbisdiaboli]